MTDSAAITGRLSAVFTRVRSEGRLHVRCLDSGREVGLHPDQPVAPFSVRTVLIVLEYARQVTAGRLDATGRVPARISGFVDEVEVSLRDLAFLAMSVHDDSAADLLLDRVGADAVRALAAELGLSIDGEGDAMSTAADLTRLLDLIWRDEAGPAEACAMTRELMDRQSNWHRIAAGFPDDVTVSGTTGTLPSLRDELAVVRYPDGGRYAVAVSVATESVDERRPDVDSAIGQAARIAVDHLRGSRR